MAPDEPRRTLEGLWCALSRVVFAGDQHLKGQLRQRPGSHDEEVFALNHVLNPTKQGLVESTCPPRVEGQRLSDPVVRRGVVGLQQLRARRVGRTPCAVVVETTTQCRHLAPK